MIDDPKIDAFVQKLLAMSLADASVLEAGIKTPDSILSTAPHSDNERLWSEMEKQGWMSKGETLVPLKDRPDLSVLTFKITSDGIKPIGEILDIALKRRKDDSEQAKKVVDVLNDLYPRLVSEIVDPIRAAGGSPKAVMMLLSSITTAVLNNYVPSSHHQALLDEFVVSVKQGLENQAHT